MAQKRHRPKFTATLDPDVRARAEAILTELPVKVSLSRLIDMLIHRFALVEEATADVPTTRAQKAELHKLAVLLTIAELSGVTA